MRLRNWGKGENAKQFTMMQQICANGPLHFPEECVILAEYIYRKCIDNMIFKVHFIIQHVFLSTSLQSISSWRYESYEAIAGKIFII
jgi:hypothetical protein